MAKKFNILKYEDLVFALLQEYFQQKKHFDMEKIIPFLTGRLTRRKIDFNREGIKKILISLLRQNLIVEGISLTKNDILMNENRKDIHNFIKTHPGAYLNRIVSKLKMPNHVVIWHLNILIEFQYIRRELIGIQPVYSEVGLNSEVVKSRFIISKKKSQEIINYLRINNNGLTKTQIKKGLSMHHNTLTKYIDDLEEINIIIKKKIGKSIIYSLNEK